MGFEPGPQDLEVLTRSLGHGAAYTKEANPLESDKFRKHQHFELS